MGVVMRLNVVSDCIFFIRCTSVIVGLDRCGKCAAAMDHLRRCAAAMDHLEKSAAANVGSIERQRKDGTGQI